MIRERGSSTVLAVGVLGLLVAVTVAALALAQAAVGARQAANAADQAALAVAAAVSQGASDTAACGIGGDIASRNRGRLVDCVLSGTVVTVRAEARVALPTLLGGVRWATASARAGPEADR
jgi:secretion/DNA translocation related TadE-like protein